MTQAECQRLSVAKPDGEINAQHLRSLSAAMPTTPTKDNIFKCWSSSAVTQTPVQTSNLRPKPQCNFLDHVSGACCLIHMFPDPQPRCRGHGQHGSHITHAILEWSEGGATTYRSPSPSLYIYIYIYIIMYIYIYIYIYINNKYIYIYIYIHTDSFLSLSLPPTHPRP